MAQGLRVHIICAEDLRSQPLVWCPLQVSIGAVNMCTYPQIDTGIHNLNQSFKKATWCDVLKFCLKFSGVWLLFLIFDFKPLILPLISNKE